MRCSAIGAPMMTSPMKPICMILLPMIAPDSNAGARAGLAAVYNAAVESRTGKRRRGTDAGERHAGAGHDREGQGAVGQSRILSSLHHARRRRNGLAVGAGRARLVRPSRLDGAARPRVGDDLLARYPR